MQLKLVDVNVSAAVWPPTNNTIDNAKSDIKSIRTERPLLLFENVSWKATAMSAASRVEVKNPLQLGLD